MHSQRPKSLVEQFFFSNDLSITPLFEDIYHEARQNTLPPESPTDGSFEKDVAMTPEGVLPKDIIPLGTLYVGEWGYDQTNAYFFEVVGFTGSQTVLLKRLQSKVQTDHPSDMSGIARPIKGTYADNIIYKARVRWETWKDGDRLPSLKISKNSKNQLASHLILFPANEVTGTYTTWYA